MIATEILMLVTCLKCKKPVFVSSSIVASGEATIPCNACSTALVVTESGSVRLQEEAAVVPQPAEDPPSTQEVELITKPTLGSSSQGQDESEVHGKTHWAGVVAEPPMPEPVEAAIPAATTDVRPPLPATPAATPVAEAPPPLPAVEATESRTAVESELTDAVSPLPETPDAVPPPLIESVEASGTAAEPEPESTADEAMPEELPEPEPAESHAEPVSDFRSTTEVAPAPTQSSFVETVSEAVPRDEADGSTGSEDGWGGAAWDSTPETEAEAEADEDEPPTGQAWTVTSRATPAEGLATAMDGSRGRRLPVMSAVLVLLLTGGALWAAGIVEIPGVPSVFESEQAKVDPPEPVVDLVEPEPDSVPDRAPDPVSDLDPTPASASDLSPDPGGEPGVEDTGKVKGRKQKKREPRRKGKSTRPTEEVRPAPPDPQPPDPVPPPVREQPETKAKAKAKAKAPPPQAGPAELHYKQGNLFLKEKKVALAIEEFKKCLAANPKFGLAYRSLGVAYMLLGREKSAIHAYEKFVTISPGHRDAPKVRQIISDYYARNPR
ncbi:hypothetical protein ACFL6C_00240 [Myxococcota bacterium]